MIGGGCFSRVRVAKVLNRFSHMGLLVLLEIGVVVDFDSGVV